MIRRKNLITTLSLVLMITFPFPGFSMPESGETVTRRGTVDDDYYAAGGTVDINALISGDWWLACFCLATVGPWRSGIAAER